MLLRLKSVIVNAGEVAVGFEGEIYKNVQSTFVATLPYLDQRKKPDPNKVIADAEAMILAGVKALLDDLQQP